MPAASISARPQHLDLAALGGEPARALGERASA